jgi:hypothetical protein|nr:MAG TPA: hypothetical protein [Caudoviricetes sp.]
MEISFKENILDARGITKGKMPKFTCSAYSIDLRMLIGAGLVEVMQKLSFLHKALKGNIAENENFSLVWQDILEKELGAYVKIASQKTKELHKMIEWSLRDDG